MLDGGGRFAQPLASLLASFCFRKRAVFWKRAAFTFALAETTLEEGEVTSPLSLLGMALALPLLASTALAPGMSKRAGQSQNNPPTPPPPPTLQGCGVSPSPNPRIVAGTPSRAGWARSAPAPAGHSGPTEPG